MTGFWLRTLTHVNFNHVNKIQARYKVLRLNVKLSEVLLLRLRATFYTLPLFYLLTKFTHVGARKKLGDRGDQPLHGLIFLLLFAHLIALKNLTQACLALAWWKGKFKKLLQQCYTTKLTNTSRINKILLTYEALIHLVFHIRQ